jgi:hypothetical protein
MREGDASQFAAKPLHNLEQVRVEQFRPVSCDSGRGHRQALTFKKPALSIEQQQQPRNIQRADIAPENGYAMVVDGRFKTHFSEGSAAKAAATELLARYPMLQIEIYNAASKSRTRVQPKTLDEATQ